MKNRNRGIALLTGVMLALQPAASAFAQELDWAVDSQGAPAQEDDGWIIEVVEPEVASEGAGSMDDVFPDGGDFDFDQWDEEQQRETTAPADSQVLQEDEDQVMFLLPADRELIYSYLQDLKKEEDPTGSDGEIRTAAMIGRYMSGLGYTVQEMAFHEGELNPEEIDLPGICVIAERGANSPDATEDILIICARYDSRNPAGNTDQVKPGRASQAEDAASYDPLNRTSALAVLENEKGGAAVLMEAARILAESESDVDLCFLFVSGEEDGYYGSARFAEFLEETYKDRVRGVICLGTVGMEAFPVKTEKETEGETESEKETETAFLTDAGLPALDREESEEIPYYLGTASGLPNRMSEHVDAARRYLERRLFTEDSSLENQEMDDFSTPQEHEAEGREPEDAKDENPDAKDENPDGKDSEEEKLKPWDIAPAASGSHIAFDLLGLPAVTIFQDVTGEAYVDPAGPEDSVSADDGPDAEGSEEVPEAEESEAAPEAEGKAASLKDDAKENEKKEVRQMTERLRSLTDLVVLTAASFMDEETENALF